MNYTFRKDDGDLANPDDEGTFIGIQFMDEWARPQLGQELILTKFSTKTWRVVRVIPPSNPTGQSNTYYLEEV